MTTNLQDRLSGGAGLAFKAPVRAASTANLTLSGTQTVDGVALVDGDRVLAKDQTTASQNGIYICRTGAWDRAPDWDGNSDVVQGTLVFVTNGSVNANTLWGVATTGTIIVGTTGITFNSMGLVLVTSSPNPGTLLTLTSTDAGASAGPVLTLDRNSISPAASDIIGQLAFNGRDSGNNSTNYGAVHVTITDPTDGSEDSRLILRALRAGAVSDWRNESGALYHQSQALPSGNGDIGCNGLAVGGNETVTGTLTTTGLITANGGIAATSPFSVTLSDDTAGLGPNIGITRVSATPAASDILGHIQFNGRDSNGNSAQYAAIYCTILDPTDTSEDGQITIAPIRAGSPNNALSLAQGIWTATATGTDKGLGTVNSKGYYIDGQPVGQTITFSADKGGAGAVTLTSTVAVQITFGTENWDVGNAFASNAWTPPAGKYQIDASVEIDVTNAVDNEQITIALRKDGADHRIVRFNRPGTGSMSVNLTALVDANGSNVFTIFVTKGGAGNGATTATATTNYFQGTAL